MRSVSGRNRDRVTSRNERAHAGGWRLWCMPAFVVLLAFCTGASAQQINETTFAGLHWRFVGPYNGGRAEAAAGVSGTNTYYFGAVAGGVWKSIDAGEHWAPIFDKEPVASIGALAIAPSDPNVIYAGTGEEAIRGDISYGDGMWRSTDAGKTWTHIGLEKTQHVAAILVDPHDADVALVAALGDPFGPSPERGVFRTSDGGKTWAKVLYKDDQTGAVDLVFDPQNSRIVYAALYQISRTPWGFTSGGPGSGIYRSTDEGVTWKQLSGHGLPDGVLGRIGLAVGADSEHVYALIEAKKGGLYASDDAGRNWRFVTDDHRFRQRAWYFTNIYADPKNPDTIYILNTSVYRSTDGGRTWATVGARTLGDNHCLWIDPAAPGHMIVADDGGASVTVDGGQTWSSESIEPISEFYHVAVDGRSPYYLYGAQQDDGTVAIASQGDGRQFYDVGGGESGWVVPTPSGNTVYADGYDGAITRFDRRNRTVTDISPWPLNPMGYAAADLKYRFQWTAPIALSPFDDHTVYFGGDVLFRTTDSGQSWTVISPDLTRNDKGKEQSAGGPITQDNTSAEYYDTIFCIAPSAVAHGEIWVGTDDGLIQLTRDGGAHWTNVTPRDMPAWYKISILDASHFSAGTAYAAVNGEKSNDFAPYIYKTTDFGQTWSRINNGIPDGAYVHAVREDTTRRDLLFAGTEFGVYVSFDGGANWGPLQMNLPAVPVRDLVIHDDDLLIATHGRGFWALDDIAPLRQFTSEISNEAAYLFHPAVAFRGFHGSATIDYWLKSAPKGAVTLAIYDAKGALVHQYSSKANGLPDWVRPEYAAFVHLPHVTAQAGINRFAWDLRYPADRVVKGAVTWGGSPRGPVAIPGTYQVKLTVDGQSFTAPLIVRESPQISVTQADLERQLALALRIQAEVNAADEAVNEILSVRSQLTVLEQRVGPQQSEIADAARTLGTKASAIEDALIDLKSKSGEDPLNFPVRLADQIMALGGSVESSDAAPTTAESTVFATLKTQIDAEVGAWNLLQKKDLAALNAMVRRDNVPFVAVPAPGPGSGQDREER